MLRVLIAAAMLSCATALVRMDCHPEPGASQQNCEARGCIWTPAEQGEDPHEPWCFLAPGVGYKYVSQTGSIISLSKNSGPKNPWGADFESLTFAKTFIGETLNLRISIGNRYEPDLNLPKAPSTSSDSLSVETHTDSDPFSFAVVRESTSRKLFDTSVGGLIFSDQFIQIASYLPSQNMYGWGENIHQTLKHNFTNYLTWGMFARDEPPNSGNLDTKNLYGVHPFYMMIEPDGKAHGVLILNSNAQEVTTTPGPAFIYRTTGGMLDMYFFPGPSPADVIRQYQALIGHPFLPAYWALGYQLSRYGYKNLDEMKEKIGNVRNYNIPMDTAVVDIDYMERYKDFTVGQQNWSGLSTYVQQMKSWGMKLILIFDPAIEVDYPSFQRGLDQNARFIEWERMDQVQQNIQNMYPMAKDTKIMLGVVWPDKHVAFPDFLDQTNQTIEWWISEFNTFHKEVAFDGIWIDMNEPSNFGTNEDHPWYYDNPDHPDALPLKCTIDPSSKDSFWDMPPYKTHNVWNFQDQEYLSTKTLCMNAVQQNGQSRFYNVKNLYGWSESKATQQALYASTGKRGAVISRSTFPSSGRFTGHWLGDNTARWEDLRTSVIGAQEFNMFGIPYVGSDVCGFIGTTTEELCLRWQQMGAFHSFFRNHNNNGSPPQDPAEWPTVAAATRKANMFRYQYMPYLYTLHFNAWKMGGTVIHPVFFEFPNDEETHNLGYQFMWGPNIMVAPVLNQGATSVSVYIPDGSFYSLFDYNYGRKFDAGTQTVPAPTTSQIPTFVREGSVIPRQTPNVTTDQTRTQPFEVLVVPNKHNIANGTLVWDDGDSVLPEPASYKNYYSIEYQYTGTDAGAYLEFSAKTSGTVGVTLPTLDIIEIFNYPKAPDFSTFKVGLTKVAVNVQCSTYSAITKILKLCIQNQITYPTSNTATLHWSNVNMNVLELDETPDERTFYKY